jgi:hypothetical protein
VISTTGPRKDVRNEGSAASSPLLFLFYSRSTSHNQFLEEKGREHEAEFLLADISFMRKERYLTGASF